MYRAIDFIRYKTPEFIKVKFGFIPFCIIGFILSILKIKYVKRNNINLLLQHNALNFTLKGMLFSGYYESTEPLLIEKYLNENMDTIELGAGIGLSTLKIIKKIKKKKLISIEPDKTCFDLLLRNFNFNNLEKKNKFFLNYALDYFNKVVIFKSYEMFLTNHVVDNRIYSTKLWKVKDQYEIETIKLREIIKQYNLDKYQLVSDIEGKEIELIQSGDINPKFCKMIIMDLHDIKYENKKINYIQMIDSIKKIGYNVEFQSINQLVFKSKY